MSSALVEDLQGLLGERRVFADRPSLRAYAYDATGEKHMPLAVAFPASTAEVAGAVALAAFHDVPVVARGAGTNLSGGTVPSAGGLVISLQRLNRILAIDSGGRRAVVEPGVTNLRLQEALAPHGFFYAPDPSSMKVSTLGGNIGENAGGPRCLKYGVTVGHVLALQVVLADGSVVEIGSGLAADPGYDLTALVCGSEGTLAIVTQATVRITPLPRAARTLLVIFADLAASSRAVSAVVAAGIIPACLELLDRHNLGVLRASGFTAYPDSAAAALIIEVDGDEAAVAADAERIVGICRAHGAQKVRLAADPAERAELWAGRRAAYGAQARFSPYLWVQDVTVPRDRLTDMLQAVHAIAEQHGVRIYAAAHAGDGNLHPVIPYDPRDPEETARVAAADRAILAACVEMGGSITGEHGVGLDKLPGMPLQFSAAQLACMHTVRRVFDPVGRLNPGKLLPAAKGGF